MKLTTSEIIENNKTVILRMDTDLPIKDGVIIDNSRLVKSLELIKKLLFKNIKIIILGHLGRPEGKIVPELSLKMVYIELIELLEKKNINIKSIFIEDFTNSEIISKAVINNQIIFCENVRFWKEEDSNDYIFLKELMSKADYFINDAFAVAHRASASTTLFNKLKTVYGDSFAYEIEKISKLVEKPEKPITLIIGGAKKDKLNNIVKISENVDYILMGGKLPDLIEEDVKEQILSNKKIFIADFDETGFDISQKSIDKFCTIISCSKTIIWAGAMGFYEKEEYRNGTNIIASTIANSDAYTVIAGGDTAASIISLGLKNKIDFVCSGGGVMLEYLANKKLPTIK